MATAVSKQITRYYDVYRDKEITFTKEILHYLRIDPRQIYIKCAGGQWPCIINSTSLQFVKVIIGTTSGALVEIRKNSNLPVSVRYSFIEADSSPLSFFVNGHVTDVSPFRGSNDLVMLTISFSQQPPDDLIERLGQFIDTNENFKNRKNELVILNPDIVRKLGLQKVESLISIENVPRNCILKEIAFGAAKIMFLGIPKFVVNKNVVLQIKFIEPEFVANIPGTIKSADFMEGRNDIVLAILEFNEDQVPMAYKVQINEFLTINAKMNKQALQEQQQAAIEQRKAMLAQQAAQQAQQAQPQ